jgi:hypothetical protein
MSRIEEIQAHPELVTRHPLGLPAGSVRSVIAILITGLLCTIILLPPEQPVRVPLFVYFLTSLVLAFFTAFSGGITYQPHERQPLNLPRGSARFLIVLAVVASVGYAYYRDPEVLLTRLTPQADQLQQWPYLTVSLAAGFFLGLLAGKGPWRHAPMFQDALASLSLVCMIGLGIETIVVLFINPHLEQDVHLTFLENALVAMVAFYFGARSHSR